MNNFKKVITLALLAITLLGVALPTMADSTLQPGTSGKVVVNSAGLKIRKSSPADSVYQLVGNGTIVSINSRTTSGGVVWYHITITSYVAGPTGTAWNGYQGYAHSDYIEAIGGAPTTPPGSTWHDGYVNTSSGTLYLRQTPSTSGGIITSMPQYASLRYQSPNNGWSYVKYGSLYGYASFTYIGAGSAPTNPGTQPLQFVGMNQSSHNYNQYHTKHYMDYFNLANQRFVSKGYDIYNEACYEYNYGNGHQCTGTTGFFVKLQFYQLSTRPCTRTGCTTTTDRIVFGRCCNIAGCGINGMYYDEEMYQDIHSNASCPLQAGPYW